jgi:hypothetical protein
VGIISFDAFQRRYGGLSLAGVVRGHAQRQGGTAMSRTRIGALGSILAVALVTVGGVAFADNNPVDEKWWPSEFGPDDQAGATNYITPEKRLAAAKLVKQGKVITLGMPYSNYMPLVPGRTFALSIPGAPTHGPLNWPGDNFDQTFMDELVTAEIGQVGTQFDGLAHPMIHITGVKGVPDDNYFYNGVSLSQVETARGLKKNGTENVGSFFTRGILIDITALKGVDQLEIGYAVTLDDYKKALQAQGIGEAEKGDVVLFRTGWNQWWKDNHTGNKKPDQIAADNDSFRAGEPGISPQVCDYLIERKISMIGIQLPQGWPTRLLCLLPHEPDRAARHLQLREPRPRQPVAG